MTAAAPNAGAEASVSRQPPVPKLAKPKMQWKRPPEASDTQTTSNASASDAAMTSNEATVPVKQSQRASRNATSGPILSGPKPKLQWKRESVQSDTTSVVTTAASSETDPAEAEAAAVANHKHAPKLSGPRPQRQWKRPREKSHPPTMKDPRDTQTVPSRGPPLLKGPRATMQWTRPRDDEAEAANEPANQVIQPAPVPTKERPLTFTGDAPPIETIMRRKGKRKLERVADQGPANGQPAVAQWTKMAPHKLVPDRAVPTRQSKARRGPKRIKLAASYDDGGDASGSDQEGKPAAEKRLTDFAYRVTSKPRKRGPNMGLVRVPPNEARTKICPTFLRGMPCTNERCLKRHDIDKEFAMPVCMFFQRQGMCLRDECPFRHVKVNPYATPCPSFGLLGFCDDPECTMMHSRPNPANK